MDSFHYALHKDAETALVYFMGKTNFSLFCLSIFLTIGAPAFCESYVEIKEIVIVANKTAQSRRQIPNTVDVVDTKNIVLNQSSKISDALKQVSGITISEKGLVGEDLDIRMRGSDRDEVLVLFDGVPIEGNGESRAFFLNFLPAEFIEKIEVIKGAQSILYGSNAVGGVINIISKKKAPEGQKHFAQVSYTSTNSFRETFSNHVGSEKTSLFFGVMRDDSNVFDNFHDRSSTTGLHSILNHELSDRVKLTWGLDGFYGRHNLSYDQINAFTAAGTLNSYVVADDDIYRKIGWFQSQIQVEVDVTDRLTTHFQMAGNYLTEILANSQAGDNPVDETGAPLIPNSQYYEGHSYRIFGDLLNQYRLIDSQHIKDDVQVGFNFIHDHLDFVSNSFPSDVGVDLPFTSLYPDVGEESGRENYALYFQNLFYWKDFTATAGARVDHNTTFGNEWSPRVGLTYTHAKTATTIRTSYSEGFHAPTIPEFFDATVGGTVTALAMKQAQETTRSYEVGLEQAFLDDKLKLRSTYFYTHYDQLLDIVEAIDDANSYGVENDLTLSLIPQTVLGANYTYNRTHNNDTGGELTLRPRHTVNAYVEIEPFKNFTLRTQMKYMSRRKNPETLSLTIGDFPVLFYNSLGQTATHLSSHVVFDLLLNYEWNKPFKKIETINFYASATNLLNEQYENNFGYPAPGFRLALGSNVSF